MLEIRYWNEARLNSNGMPVSADNTPPWGLWFFSSMVKVGTEKTKSQGGIFMHMADALVTPAVAGTMYACPAAVLVFIYEARPELLYGSDVTQAEAGKLSFQKDIGRVGARSSCDRRWIVIDGI